MKKRITLLLSFICVLAMCMTSFAAGSKTKTDEWKANYTLVSYDKIDNDDGTYTIERTYKHANSSAKRGILSKANTYGTDTFTKEADTYSFNGGSLICSYQVTATFDWDKNNKTVYVYDEEGEITYQNTDGYGAYYTNKKTVTKGDGTKKATAKFSFTRTPKGNTTTYKHYVSISCNYKGTDSGKSR